MLRFVAVMFIGLATAAVGFAQRQPGGTATDRNRGAGAGAAPGSNGRADSATTAADRRRDSSQARATFEVYKDKAGEYRWRLRATNTQILAIAAQGYSDKRSCLNAIESVKRDVASAPIEEKDTVAQGKENTSKDATTAGSTSKDAGSSSKDTGAGTATKRQAK